MATLRWGSASHEGQLRTQNEDNFHAGDGLFVVADGMGGHLAGEVASEMAVRHLNTALPAAAGSRADLITAISAANIEIYNSSVTNPEQAGMGTTITAIAVVDDPHDGEVLAVANVGDSRGYVLRHGRLRQVTIDHSFVQELVAEGAITRAEARAHPRRNIVTRALGIEPSVRVDTWTMPIIRGDRFLLCSDGLVDEVDDSDIQAILLAHPDDPTAAANALIVAANAAGGRDNVTAVVFDVIDGDDPPDPTEEFDVSPLWIDDAVDLDDTGETHIVADPLDDALVAAAAAADTNGAAIPTLPPRAAAAPAEPAADPDRRRRRRRALGRAVLLLGVFAVLILGFSILAAWARGGYYIDFDDDERVAIFQGRKDGFLWFDPTREKVGQFTRDEIDADSIEFVERRVEFSRLGDAEAALVRDVRSTTTTTTTTTTSTTTTTTSTTSTTSTTIAASTTTIASTTSPTTVAGG